MEVFESVMGLFLMLAIGFGIVGNVLSFIVWTKGRRCRKLPGGIYLRALAVSDTIALCIPATNEAVSLLSQRTPQHENAFFCKTEAVGRHYGLLVSSWIIVCFTIERTVAVFKTSTSTSWVGKRTFIAIVLNFVANFLFNLPYGLVHEIIQTTVKQRIVSPLDSTTDFIIPENFGNVSLDEEVVITEHKQECGCDPSSFFSFLNWYHTWLMDFVLIFLIPFTLITASNLMVMLLVILRRKTLYTRQGTMAKAVTMRAVVVSVVHCITTGPFSITVLIPGYLDRALTVKYSQEYYVNKVSLTLAFLNHAVNFVLYSFFGTDFRRDCANIICRRSMTVHPENSERLRMQSFRQNNGTGEDQTSVEMKPQGKDKKTHTYSPTNIFTVSL